MSELTIKTNGVYESINPLVTVVTCVYNRADKIHRVFDSMKVQTYDCFEHVIVDDGSVDNIDEKVYEYMNSVPFPVKYIKKENGGKHTATNTAWANARGKYVVNLDSDDGFVPHAVEHMVKLWDEIPEKDRHLYWCVQARCFDHGTGKMIGALYPDNINRLSGKELEKELSKVHGDKTGLQVLEKVREIGFEEPEGVKFVSEGTVWRVLNKKYKTYYSNEMVKEVYFDEQGRISNESMSKQTVRNRLYNNWYLTEHSKDIKNSFNGNVVYFLRFGLYYWRADREFKKMHKFRLSNIFKQLAFWLLTPLFLIKVSREPKPD